MNDLVRRIASLSPEKRRLFELMLAEAEADAAVENDTPANPQSDAGNRLAEIWKATLGLTSVREDDNFFELGGDSIQAIQIVAKARRAGIEISTNDLFAHPTIKGLLARGTAAPAAAQGSVYGAAPPTPIQHWFFERALPQPQHWNQSVLLEWMGPIDLAALREALQTLYLHHDALRLRFEPQGSGWRQEIMPVDSSLALLSEYPVEKFDEVRSALENGFDLSRPPLFHAAIFRGGADLPALLLFAIHHLVTDGVSLRVVLEDLALAYSQALGGSAPALPPKTASFIEWSRALHEHAQTAGVEAETAYWLGQLSPGAVPLPLDHPGGENSEASAATLTRVLAAEETTRVSRETTGALRASLHELLLAALAATLRDWTANSSILIEVEGHGRESARIGLDVSRTAGWFTSLFPMRLDVPVSHDAAAVLAAVKQAVRGVPDHGLGYGLLRYKAAGSPLRALPAMPQVLFNYLGHFQTVQVSDLRLRAIFPPDPPLYGPRNPRSHVLQVMTSVVDGELRLDWIYSRALHRPETMERLADAFIAALRGFMALPAGAGPAIVASDFPDADLDEDDMRTLFGTKR
jgi:non-ribosomal peptide synthase protein (TIGR01720 family)